MTIKEAVFTHLTPDCRARTIGRKRTSLLCGLGTGADRHASAGLFPVLQASLTTLKWNRHTTMRQFTAIRASTHRTDSLRDVAVLLSSGELNKGR